MYASDPTMLAFASGNMVRTLAPTKAGVYRINYGCYVAGNPRLVAEATIVVTVLPGGANQPPVPVTLTGRVLSGQTVAIGFDDYGIDPDGDAVRLDQVLTQPKSGSAAVSGDGKSISYTSVAGFSGQVEFGYRVVDSEGAVGVGVVRIGVLTRPSILPHHVHRLRRGSGRSGQSDPGAGIGQRHRSQRWHADHHRGEAQHS